VTLEARNTELTILWEMMQCSLMQCFGEGKLTPWRKKQQVDTNRWCLRTRGMVQHTWWKHNLIFLTTQRHKTRNQVGLFTRFLSYTLKKKMQHLTYALARTVTCKPATYSWPEYLGTVVMTCLRVMSVLYTVEKATFIMTEILSGKKYEVSRTNYFPTLWPTTTF
jgi:hypothetical protein